MHKKNKIVKAFLQSEESEGTGEGVQRTTGLKTRPIIEKKELDYLKDELDKIKIKPKYIKITIRK
jgi:hypothetical protein